MRTWTLLATAATMASVGCVTDDPVDPPAQVRRVPRSRPTARAVQTPRSAATRAPIAPGETWYPRGRAISPRWTTVVVHHSATARGGARAFDRYHREQRGWDELGYHFVIGNGTSTPDGLIEVGPRWEKQKAGAHCKTRTNYFNEQGIGICLVGDFTRTRPTSKQLGSLRRLMRFLMTACRIPAERITTHRAVTGKTRCPGQHFSLPALRRSLASAAHLP